MTPLPSDDLEAILRNAREDFESLNQASIFITGGTGFFGIWLVESLLFAKSALGLETEIEILTRDTAKSSLKFPHWHGRVNFVEGDVRSFVRLGQPYSHCVHAATEASATLNANAPLEMFDVVVEGTRRVLQNAGPRGQILYVSSGAVYGRQPAEITHVTEEYPGAPDCLDVNSAYGNGKRAAEWLCAQSTKSDKQLKIVVARPFAFIGPYLPLDTHFAAGNFLRDALSGDTIRIGGDGTPLRSYLYAADLAAWMWRLLVRGESGRAYNVGSDEAVSIAELARTTAKVAGTNKVEIAKEPVPGAAPARYVPSIERARKELGLEVWTPLETAIEKTLAWHRMAK
jgi:dTDP-glucose 4,6-dehydratase